MTGLLYEALVTLWVHGLSQHSKALLQQLPVHLWVHGLSQHSKA